MYLYLAFIGGWLLLPLHVSEQTILCIVHFHVVLAMCSKWAWDLLTRKLRADGGLHERICARRPWPRAPTAGVD